MCVLIHKKAAVKLREAIYDECWRLNNDGVGIAFVDPEKKALVIEKGFMNKKDALAAIRAREDLELMIHFRKISRGPANKDNCHPFLVESGFDDDGKNPRWTFAIGHNGTIDIKPDPGMSDTRTWVELVLKPWLDRDPYLFEYNYSRFTLDAAVGSRNKVCIFRYDNLEHKFEVFYLNRKEGNESLGCWFSNYQWMPISEWNSRDGYGGGYDSGKGAAGPKVGRMGGYYVNDKWVQFKDSRPGETHSTGETGQDNRRPTAGEGFPDHLGWKWDNLIKKFHHEKNGAWVAELTYRKPYEDDYIYQGAKYRRTAHNWDDKGIAYALPPPNPIVTQTTLPGVSTALVTKPSVGDKAEANKPGDKEIVVPRDPPDDGGPTKEDVDEWNEALQLSEGLTTGSIEHLSKKQQRKMRQIATDYCKAMYGEAQASMSLGAQIAALRSDYVEAFPEAQKLNLTKLDEALIARGGFLRREMYAKHKEENAAEIERDSAMFRQGGMMGYD